MYQTSFSAFLDSLGLSRTTDFPQVRDDPHSTCSTTGHAHSLTLETVCMRVCESHYRSGYEKDGDTLLLFADVNTLLERFVFTLRLLWKRTGGVNYLRKHVVEIRLQCQHCLGVTLLMGKFENKIISL